MVSSCIPVTKEPIGLTRLDGKRPDRFTLISWKGGKSPTCDVTAHVCVAFESLRPFNLSGFDTMREVSQRLIVASDDPRETSVLFQRLSILIQSGRTHELQRTVSRCFVALRQLRQIRRSVPSTTLQMLWSHWCIPGWIMGLACWSAFRLTWCANSSRSWMRRLRLSTLASANLRPYKWCTHQSSLIAGSAKNRIQTDCADV